jgi:hypothetical protein
MTPEEAFNVIREHVAHSLEELDQQYATNKAIAPLDWHTYACQCTHHRPPCKQPAKYVCHIHALHRCDTDDVDMFGNRIELLCAQCVSRLKAHINYHLGKLNAIGVGCCGSCGAPIVELSDVLREVVKL